MEYSAIYHDMDKRWCYCLEPDHFLIRVRTKKDDMARVILHWQDKYLPIKWQDTREEAPMVKVSSDTHWDYYELELHFHVVCLRYFFEFTDQAGEHAYLGSTSFSPDPVTDLERMFDCPQNLREEERLQVPGWAKGKVVYQVFPSRFAASQPVPDKQWYKAPVSFRDDLHGDLRGVINRLGYIRDLGVDVLYMTPVFHSNSCHKYDTIDYYRIDPAFGTKEDLKELVGKAHDLGMRVILDGVFNHTAPEFFAFADIMEKGWDSPYIDWYFIEGFPLVRTFGKKPNFKCFSYFGGMPKLNLRNPAVEQYILDVARYWIRECDIDGWRLDVGDEISHRFWKHFREAVKQEKEDLLIIGEVWHYAPDFLEGDEWDTVMNYHFYQTVVDLVATRTIDSREFLERMGSMRGRIHSAVYPILWNLIGSHDTPRFLYECGGDSERLAFAAALQLLLPGMPMIYYGDEVGLTGARDPDCRRGMLWEEKRQDRKLLARYKALIRTRHAYPCLMEGMVLASAADDDRSLLIFVLGDGDQNLTLIFHPSDSPLQLPEYTGRIDRITESLFNGILDPWSAVAFSL